MISDAFTLKPATISMPDGSSMTVRRPSALDMIEAIAESKRAPETFGAWLVYRHARDGDAPMFATLDEVLKCDAHAVAAVSAAIQRLYEEGRD
jgi:hypothetical protein